jgi:hypothetical protein
LAAFRLEVLTGNGPPDDTILESQRKLRQNEVAAQAVLRRLVIYAIYVFVIFSVGYINRDARSYNIRGNIDNYIFYTTKATYGFESVRINNVLEFDTCTCKSGRKSIHLSNFGFILLFVFKDVL